MIILFSFFVKKRPLREEIGAKTTALLLRLLHISFKLGAFLNLHPWLAIGGLLLQGTEYYEFKAPGVV